MSVFRVILCAWIAFNAAVLSLLVIHRATHLKHRLYWRIVNVTQPLFRFIHNLVVAHNHHR
jgi:hypothetical protein